jgi:cytochrome c-type biogenesis protein CcmE
VNNMRLKLIVASTVLVGAVGYLAYAGMQKGWVYYMEVDKFVAEEQYQNQRVRLHGQVSTEGFLSSAARLTAQFNLVGTSAQVPVVYRGAIPEMFEAGRDVVVEGRLDESGIFNADVLMTKCASKYEPESPHAKKE